MKNSSLGNLEEIALCAHKAERKRQEKKKSGLMLDIIIPVL